MSLRAGRFVRHEVVNVDVAAIDQCLEQPESRHGNQASVDFEECEAISGCLLRANSFEKALGLQMGPKLPEDREARDNLFVGFCDSNCHIPSCFQLPNGSGFSCTSQPLTGSTEPQMFDARRLPGWVTPGWLVSAASPCWAASE